MAEHRIIPRDEWGAKYLGGWDVRPLPASEAWLHRPAMYSPLDVDATLEEDIAYVRRVEEVGYARFGPHNGTTWDEAAGIGAGISYTYLVMRSCRIFAGHEPHRESSHTAGHNRPGIGIAWADGIDAQAEPTVEQINATAWLLREAVRLDVLTAPAFDGGHRDVYPTSCPTDAAYKYLGTVKRAEAATPGPWGWTPSDAYCTDDAPLTDIFGNYLCASPDDNVRGGHRDTDAEYIATMHPGVGLLIAAWLDAEAAIYHRLETLRAEVSPMGYRLEWPESTQAEAEALADLILGGDA